MLYSFAELCRKEVIDVEKGEKLGYVDDLEFDAQTAAVAALVIHGRERLFGLLGRFRTADGYDADDGQCKYQYDQFKVIIP